VFFLSALLLGCGTFGSRLLPKNHQAFNIAASQSYDEQLLLNIVRLHYVDRPFFLKISSINSQFSISPSLNMQAGFKEESANLSPIEAFVRKNIRYAETPTISYTPLQGSAFTLQVLEPMSVSQIYTLIRSGWSIARVLRVCAQQIEHLENALNANRPFSKHVPQYQDFIDFAHYLRYLERNRLVSISARRVKKKLLLELSFKHYTPPKIVKLLHLKQPQKVILLGQGHFDRDDVISIRLRSFIGILYYLSKSVATPPDDIKKRRIQLTRYQNGKLFDWDNVTKGMLKVFYSQKEPQNANIKVYYRNRWFYISDSDQSSKQTMSLLNQLFALQADDSSSTGPVLTLPL